VVAVRAGRLGDVHQPPVTLLRDTIPLARAAGDTLRYVAASMAAS
jgi:hypothetical protein